MQGIVPEKRSSVIENDSDINKILITIANKALSESSDVLFSRRTFDKHKDSEAAQESRLKKGDIFEIMTNTLTYDMDDRSLDMISSNLKRGVIYYYYIEKNSIVTTNIKKFLSLIYQRVMKLCNSTEDINQIIRETLHIYWIENGVYIYNFSLMHRLSSNVQDHCSFYFIKNKKVLYEALLETVPHMAEDLKNVFEYFRKGSELNVLNTINASLLE